MQRHHCSERLAVSLNYSCKIIGKYRNLLILSNSCTSLGIINLTYYSELSLPAVYMEMSNIKAFMSFTEVKANSGEKRI
jgi:hypothetical protein